MGEFGWPSGWGTAQKFFVALLTLQFTEGRALPDLNKFYILQPAIVFLFACCWFLPNSHNITLWVRKLSARSIGRYYFANPFAKVIVRDLSYPIITGICLYMAITSISYVKSHFLYFNFDAIVDMRWLKPLLSIGLFALLTHLLWSGFLVLFLNHYYDHRLINIRKVENTGSQWEDLSSAFVTEVLRDGRN